MLLVILSFMALLMALAAGVSARIFLARRSRRPAALPSSQATGDAEVVEAAPNAAVAPTAPGVDPRHVSVPMSEKAEIQAAAAAAKAVRETMQQEPRRSVQAADERTIAAMAQLESAMQAAAQAMEQLRSSPSTGGVVAEGGSETSRRG